MGGGSGVAVRYGAVLRLGLDLALLWLWCKLAAVAPIQPLSLETSIAMGAALKSLKKKKKRGNSAIWDHMDEPEEIMLSEISQSRKERQILHDSTYVRYLKESKS